MYLHYALIYLFVLYSKRYDFNLYWMFIICELHSTDGYKNWNLGIVHDQPMVAFDVVVAHF